MMSRNATAFWPRNGAVTFLHHNCFLGFLEARDVGSQHAAAGNSGSDCDAEATKVTAAAASQLSAVVRTAAAAVTAAVAAVATVAAADTAATLRLMATAPYRRM